MNLFPLALVAIGVVGVSFWHNQTLRNFLAKRKTPKSYLPTVVTTLVMTAQLSELIKAVEHVDFVHISAAIMLLTVIVAGKKGTENHTD